MNDAFDTTTTTVEVSSLPFSTQLEEDGEDRATMMRAAAAAVEEEEALPVTAPVLSLLESELMALIYSKEGTPFETRQEAIQAMRALMSAGDKKKEFSSQQVTNAATKRQLQQQTQRPSLSNVHGMGPLLLSDIPESARKPGVCVGIDEAGRGSVLGPMVYGAAFWNAALTDEKTKIPQSFEDSKQLTEEVRAKLLEDLMAAKDIGWCARVLHASEISRNMLRAGKSYNLNQMSHDSAMAMIRAILKAGVPIQTCYIDTVGNADSYRRKLEHEFPSLEFVVESKADAKYATCSAASVVAKNIRDRMLENWQFTEPFHPSAITRDFGSGYPSDPKCKQWMANNLHNNVFGWPDLVRFSWGPAKKTLLKDATLVTFEADDEEEEETAEQMAGRKRQQEQMSSFLKKANKQQRYPYFERNNLRAVSSLF